ncbi:dicarboxylate carrier UCP2-like [Tubulanus polymorphus]|uniref:dicarboxylate carrier UCP2-like n=1 Tax=Tubulanus polymorphus TaxID=672921 RepID=UPI003DA31B56
MVGFKPLTEEPTITVKFFSAGIAASTADLFTFPLDVAKVRLQIQGEGCVSNVAVENGAAALESAAAKVKYRGMLGTIATIAKEEGFFALYNGIVPGLQRQMCFASVRIGLYDTVKGAYSSVFGGETSHHTNIPLRIAAGITTGGLAVVVAQPTDVVKVRFQAPGGKQRYAGCMDAYRCIAKKEGLKGLWKGAIPNITRNAVVNAAELVSYDLVKEFILHRNLMHDTLPCHFTSAFCAGFITTCFASPVDVVKTRFMNSGPGVYNGAIDCALKMFKEGGLAAFYKGFVPNYMRLGSWNILTFVLFEQLKRGMSHYTSDSNSNTGGEVMYS